MSEIPTWLERLLCWLRFGHRWYHLGTDDRECTRCGLRQYVAIEDENGGKSWETDRNWQARSVIEAEIKT